MQVPSGQSGSSTAVSSAGSLQGLLEHDQSPQTANRSADPPPLAITRRAGSGARACQPGRGWARWGAPGRQQMRTKVAVPYFLRAQVPSTFHPGPIRRRQVQSSTLP